MSQIQTMMVRVVLVLAVGFFIIGETLAQASKSGVKVVSNAVATNYSSYANLQYANDGNIAHRLDLYVPNDGNSSHPLIIWIHEGAWNSGDKWLDPGRQQLAQVGRGYAVASINYRFSQEARFPAQVYDTKAAIRWLRANAGQYHLNAEKFGLWGFSAGAHLAALSAVSTATNGSVFLGLGDGLEDYSLGNGSVSSKVQAVLLWSGPANLTDLDATALPNSPYCHSCADSFISAYMGGTVNRAYKSYHRSNILNYLHQNVEYPPFLIMHGSADVVFSSRQAEMLQQGLEDARVRSELRIYEGLWHGALFNSEEQNAEIENFWDTNLR